MFTVIISSCDRTEIWVKLDVIQQNRCAYCEAAIKTERESSNSHIEHFRQRRAHSYPQGTFLWSNMFGSCSLILIFRRTKVSISRYKRG
ncbi:TIGR02646 family protein [Methylococcaceae bacterium CS1]|nr:TIGR02646 family protein [Methylococcaceae bacterium CS1]